MFSLTTFSSPSRSLAISSTTGATIRHGPHHGAQKSTSTGTSRLEDLGLEVVVGDFGDIACHLLGSFVGRVIRFKKYSVGAGVDRTPVVRSDVACERNTSTMRLPQDARASRDRRQAVRVEPERLTDHALALISSLQDEPMADPTNTEIAAALDELGDLYELDGAIIHRVVAYRNAAKAVREAPVSVLALARQGRATELPGIGATIQEKVLALADDGRDPRGGQAAGEVPGRADRDHATAWPRAQARAAPVRGARDRLARRAARGRRGAADPRAEGLRPEGRGERCSRR